MTLALSIVSSAFVVVANDSREIRDFHDGSFELDTRRKWWAHERIGIATCWGALEGNQFSQHLDREVEIGNVQDFASLERSLQRSLAEHFAPRERSLGDAGFHAAGFTGEGVARLSHIFWNVAGSAGAFDSRGAYCFQDQSPGDSDFQFLYNGRSDLAHPIVGAMISEVRRRRAQNFPFDALGMARFAHFALRVGAEMTVEIATPIFVLAMNRAGMYRRWRHDTLEPVSDESFAVGLRELGL